MKKGFLTLLIISFPLVMTAGNKVNIDSLYTVLDAVIDSADYYFKQKTDRIESLKKEYLRANSDVERYETATKLYTEYSPFENDSAIAYHYLCIELAEKMGRDDLKYKTLTNLAYQLANSGFYNEARIHFNEIPQQYLKGELLNQYLSGMNHLYGEMAYYSHDSKLKSAFFARQRLLQDSILTQMDSTLSSWVALKTMILNNHNKPEEALPYSDKWLAACKPNSRRFAIMAFYRSEIYKKLGDTEMQRYWLIQSAITDIRNAINDQGALWSLANSIIRDDSNLDRAYRYMDFSWNCLSHFSTHMRSWLVAPILTKINDQYKDQLRSANRELRLTVIIISVLTIVLLLLLIYVSKKRRQLSVARNELAQINQELSQLNQQLLATNEELSLSNLHLHDSNRVKEEYITKFLGLCSSYIDKLEAYRIKINRKVKANQYADILKLTSSQQMKEEELKELIINFDNVFLHLFPTFIEEFNALLKPESHIALNEDGSMTTDMRIFALIRLGLEESSRIAEFLGYSPNSIYNYRARMKNKAIGDRDEFEKKVKKIGLT